MFSLFRKKQTEPKDEANLLVEELVSWAKKQVYFVNVKKEAAYARIKGAPPELQTRVAIVLTRWMKAGESDALKYNTWWHLHQTLEELMKQKLPFDENQLIELIEWAISQRHNHFRITPQMIRAIEQYRKEHPITEKLQSKIEALAKEIERKARNSDDQRSAQRLRKAAGKTAKELPIIPGEAWAEAARAEILRLPVEVQAAWVALLHSCLMASGSAPSGKWIKEAEGWVGIIGPQEFKAAILRWFPLADQPAAPPRVRPPNWEPESNFIFNAVNADLLKGLAWLCSLSEDSELARQLAALAISAYRKLEGFGPRAVKVGNACIWALGNMPGMEGLAQLSILKVKIRQTRAQALILNATEAAAQRNRMTVEEISELSVPTYGLDTVGLRTDLLGKVRSEVHVDGSNIEQTWLREDGKHIAAAPRAVLEEFSEEIQDIKQAIKDLRKMLPAQRDRIESLFLEQRRWAFPAWRERYLAHPLVGTIVQRLIWKFSQGDQAASGIWHEGQMVGRQGEPIRWLNDETTVELWHPLQVEPQIVLEWRQWLVAHEIQQPFKQAHREIYLLTEAEAATRIYSNRFAGHVLRQHQFNALCQSRGWKNSLRLMVDAEVPPPSRLLPRWGFRVEFWIESSGDVFGTDTNDTGTYLYVATDQVRFYRHDDRENYAHAAGGGYHAERWITAEPVEALPLETIPPIVFSEIMRDVDLFVGVASVGNDPNWYDGGPQGRYVDYWHSYSFGNLSETTRTRRAVLETLLPRLKIGSRCTLSDKFLLVRGDIRTYKIHLGSGNILMEPNDQYLCIVPAQGGTANPGKIFLPFEGDTLLAVILSKAFLLAEDKKITDPTILRQIR